MGDTVAALRMLETFTSVGARSFVVTKTDVNQQLLWGKTYQADDLHRLMPAMVRTAAIRKPSRTPEGETLMAGENLIIRPTGPRVAFVQLDDLNSEQLDRVRPAVFIIHATSPGNHQAWLAVSGIPEGKEAFKEFARRVRRAVGGNDKSASHATRVAGTQNFKAKYAPEFPTVSIVETHPGRVMTADQLQSLGLLATPESEDTSAQIYPRRRGQAQQGPAVAQLRKGARGCPPVRRWPRPQQGRLLVVLPCPAAGMERRGSGDQAPGGEREGARAGEGRGCRIRSCDGHERRGMARTQPAAEPGLKCADKIPLSFAYRVIIYAYCVNVSIPFENSPLFRSKIPQPPTGGGLQFRLVNGK